MAENTLIAKTREDEAEPGTLIVESPVVGYADGAPGRGLYINPLDRVLTIKILNRRYVLRLPRDVQGRVTEVFLTGGYVPVAFGTPIARIDPHAVAKWAPGAGEGGAEGAEARETEAGLIGVASPSDGIFYRRPSPEEPPYVDAGDVVSTGSVLGMVEVMKCFNHIAYGGTGLPDRGEVVAVLAEDASEVQFGQTLFRIKPLE